MTEKEFLSLPREQILPFVWDKDPEIRKGMKRIENFFSAFTRGLISEDVLRAGVAEEAERINPRLVALAERVRAGEFR